MRRAAPSKYRAVPTVVDGIRFHSKAEARRYQELKLLEKAGEIERLECQPRFPLFTASTSGKTMQAARALAGIMPKVGEYRGDFKYYDLRGGGWIVEDVKGMDTPLSKWKRKHVKAQYGIDVQIIK
jgi:hypothetical protein